MTSKPIFEGLRTHVSDFGTMNGPLGLRASVHGSWVPIDRTRKQS